MYDAQLAARVRALLVTHAGVVEKRMFGGLSFMVDGQLCCGVLKDELVVRVGSDGFADAVAEPYARPMDFTGRPSTSMVYVMPAALASEAQLRAWVDRGLAYVRAHPR